ncbi:hypothetical protein DFJ74DRAFT_770429 [Hyaloraphidium curvatum]|nr:hypothetical protein DFJ74DRAFT_770429 [Hyaloraphidium curvatum]
MPLLRPLALAAALALVPFASAAPLRRASAAFPNATFPGDASLFQLPLAGGNTHELAPVDSDVIWVSQYDADRILRVQTSPEGDVVKTDVFPMPPGSVPHGISANSSAQAWFTLQGADRLALVGADGKIRRSIALPAGTAPHGLTTARDGSLWVAGRDGNVVLQVDQNSGAVLQSFPLGPNAGPIYIRENVDGSIWFTALWASALGRIKDGNLTLIPLDHAPGGGEITVPYDIGGKLYHVDVSAGVKLRDAGGKQLSSALASIGGAAGQPSNLPIAVEPDAAGNIWWSEESGNSMGFIPAAVAAGPASGLTKDNIQVHPLPNTGSKGAALLVTKEGSVWVQTYFPFGLARWKSGAWEQFWLPVAPIPVAPFWPTPHRIARAQDGAFWFTEMKGDRLGRVAVDAALL